MNISLKGFSQKRSLALLVGLAFMVCFANCQLNGTHTFPANTFKQYFVKGDNVTGRLYDAMGSFYLCRLDNGDGWSQIIIESRQSLSNGTIAKYLIEESDYYYFHMNFSDHEYQKYRFRIQTNNIANDYTKYNQFKYQNNMNSISFNVVPSSSECILTLMYNIDNQTTSPYDYEVQYSDVFTNGLFGYFSKTFAYDNQTDPDDPCANNNLYIWANASYHVDFFYSLSVSTGCQIQWGNYTDFVEKGILVNDQQNEESIEIKQGSSSIGIAIGAIAGSLVVIICLVVFCCLKKRGIICAKNLPFVTPNDLMASVDCINKNEMEIDKSSDCPICLDNNCDFSLLCKHVFHRNCIREWFVKANHCPQCRKVIEKRIVP